MTTLAQLREWRANGNVAAFLHVIRDGESSHDERAYRLRYPNTEFTDLSQHPNVKVPLSNGKFSSAAGAYQITFTTWSGLVKQYGFADFSPETQDLACIALLAERKAVEPLLRGDLAEAIARCVHAPAMWTSLPGGPERPRSMERARMIYADWGGWYTPRDVSPVAPDAQPAPLVSAVPAVPAKEKSMLPFIIPILAELIPQVAKILMPPATSENGQRNQALANTVIDTVVRATSALTNQAHTPASAVEALSNDKDLLAKVREAVVTHPEVVGLLEVGGGIQAAREAASNPTSLPFWKNGAFYMAAAGIVLAAFVVVWVLVKMENEQLHTQVVQAALGFATVGFAFWLGSSYGSHKKDELKS